jgi:hypothetical protein
MPLQLFVVRHIKDKQAVGFFWALHEDDLIDWVDHVTEPTLCEYQVVDLPGAFVWPATGPALGVARKFDEEDGDPAAPIELLGSLESYWQSETETDSIWHPLLIDTTELETAKPHLVVDNEPLPLAIYFIATATHVKIGSTTAPVKNRLKTLSTSHHEELRVLAVIENVRDDLEFRLHERFAKYRTRGEWFLLEGELKLWIEQGCREP